MLVGLGGSRPSAECRVPSAGWAAAGLPQLIFAPDLFCRKEQPDAGLVGGKLDLHRATIIQSFEEQRSFRLPSAEF